MRIAILSKMNHRGGGASRVAENLTLALRGRGHDAVMFTLRDHEPAAHLAPILPGPIRRGQAFLHAASEIVTGQVVLPLEFPFLRRQLRGFDLVHVQDLWTAFSPLSLRWLARQWPTCLTFHDCSAFTGGCLYMFDCLRHRQACGRCPRKREGRSWIRRIDCTAFSIRFKRWAYRGSRYHLIAPSRWMAARAVESRVFEPPVEVIANGTDLAVFNPGRRDAARQRLGLDASARVVLLSATSLDDERKGAAHGVQALNRLAAEGLDPVVLLMGAGGATIAPRLRGRVIPLGYLAAADRIADAYAAADLFLFPTRADNLPLSVQESMGCGTPVVAYAVGGVPEMIRDGENGFLVPDGASAALAERAGRILRDPALGRSCSVAAAAHARAEWSIETFCSRHLETYERIVAAA